MTDWIQPLFRNVDSVQDTVADQQLNETVSDTLLQLT